MPRPRFQDKERNTLPRVSPPKNEFQEDAEMGLFYPHLPGLEKGLPKDGREARS